MSRLHGQTLSVVVPCYNQGAFLENTLQAIKKYLQDEGADFEIIVVDDGSTDNTKKILEKFHQEECFVFWRHAKNLGKGRAVATGVLSATKENVLFLDADLAIPIEETVKFFEALNEGKDIVVGSRLVPGYVAKGRVLWYRRFLEKLFWLLRRLIIGMPHIQDTQCGYKLFRAPVAKDIFSFLTCERFSFDSEILYIASLRGYTIAELPITLQNPTKSSVRLLRDSLQMFFDLLKVRLFALRGGYQSLSQKVANITFDDFGINELTNKRILENIHHPQVKRVAIMVDGQWTESQQQALLLSGKKLDIHLTLPVLPGETKEHMAHGEFWHRVSAFLAALFQGMYKRERVQKEWQRQIEFFKEKFGRYPEGINSHEHVHFFPPFFLIVLWLANRYNMSFVRLGKNQVYRASLVAITLVFFRAVNKFLITRPVHTTEKLFSLDWGVNRQDVANEEAEILYHVERDEEYVRL